MSEKIDPKSIHLKLHDVHKEWLLLLLFFVCVAFLGLVISAGQFWSIFVESDPKLSSEDIEQSLDINIDAMQKVVDKRAELKNREIKIPLDPS